MLPPLTKPGFSISHAARYRVAVCLHHAERIADGFRRDRRHRFRGAGDVDDDAGFDGARADGRGVLVSGTDDDRTRGRQPEIGGHIGSQRADHVRRGPHGGQHRRVEARRLTQLASKSPLATSYTIVDDALAAS